MSEERRTSINWHSIVKQLPLFVLMGSVILAIAKLYFDVAFMSQHLNPEALAKWQADQATGKAQRTSTQDINDRRWCMLKRTFQGADQHQLMECMD
jgi:hypothetical protein